MMNKIIWLWRVLGQNKTFLRQYTIILWVNLLALIFIRLLKHHFIELFWSTRLRPSYCQGSYTFLRFLFILKVARIVIFVKFFLWAVLLQLMSIFLAFSNRCRSHQTASVWLLRGVRLKVFLFRLQNDSYTKTTFLSPDSSLSRCYSILLWLEVNVPKIVLCKAFRVDKFHFNYFKKTIVKWKLRLFLFSWFRFWALRPEVIHQSTISATNK